MIKVQKYNEWLNETIDNEYALKAIKHVLKELSIDYYGINQDGTVNTDNAEITGNEAMTELPIMFNEVYNDFTVEYCSNLKTLRGSPKKCKNFYCGNTGIFSLEFSPIECKKFYCNGCNNLKTLEGAPGECEWFDCSSCNNLKTLEGAPKKCELFNCSYNNIIEFNHVFKECDIFISNECEKLKSLKGLPEYCSELECRYCIALDSLEYAPKSCRSFCIEGCTSLKYLKGFPICKYANLKETLFFEIYDKLDHKEFVKFATSIESEEHQDELLIELVKQKKINLNDVVDLLLSDKYKHEYRGSISGKLYNY